MIDMAKFATKDYPLRASRIQSFVICPWRIVLLTLTNDQDKAGEPADTGSATHAAVATWHKNGGDAASAVEAMRTRIAEYPLADLKTAGELFCNYIVQPANRSAELVLVEAEVTFSLPCAEDDPTGEAVTVLGHLDQVRRERGMLKLWDIKTSKKMPHEVLWGAEMQAAAYCLGATQLLGETVHPGGIIMPRRDPMHIPFLWAHTDIPRILEPLVRLVAEVRKGNVWHVSGNENCKWCHTGGPDQCFPRLKLEVRK